MMSAEQQFEVVKSFLIDFDGVCRDKNINVVTIKVSPLLYACLRIAEELEFADGEVYCRGYAVKVEPKWEHIQYTYEVTNGESE